LPLNKLMLIVILKIHPYPEKKIEELEILRLIGTELRFQRDCLCCEVYLRSGDKGEVLYIEQWQNKEALHRHIRSELYLKFLAAMELGMERPELAIHEVTESQGMALIEKLRQVEKV
jgi:quinol monooxygenase YgiN